jgi:hypothetical protein
MLRVTASLPSPVPSLTSLSEPVCLVGTQKATAGLLSNIFPGLIMTKLIEEPYPWSLHPGAVEALYYLDNGRVIASEVA